MPSGDNAAAINRQSVCCPSAQYDLLIVGGGVIGCWTAYKAGKHGLKTLLIDTATIGAGASGGLLGALMPHMPERWDGKKQFQFEALDDLPNEISILEQETSSSCGYNQCGRIAPIMNETKRGQMQGHGPDVKKYWLGKYHWNIIDKPFHNDWPRADRATCGLVHDTLSARINPRGLLAALKKAILQDDNIDLCEGLGLSSYQPSQGKAILTDNSEVLYSHIVISAGVETFKFIAPELDVATLALGKPIKGQAAMLSVDIDPNWPILFDNGVYVISHGEGRVAIGSTSEIEFDDAFSTDKKLDDIITKARELCPLIKDGVVTERWAGLRPRAIGRDPLIDVLPNTGSEAGNVIVSTSGFKITFGVAHKMADVAIEHILGTNTTNVPDSFKIAAHLAKARRAEKQDNLS